MRPVPLHRTAPHRTAPHRTAPHRTASHRITRLNSIQQRRQRVVVSAHECMWNGVGWGVWDRVPRHVRNATHPTGHQGVQCMGQAGTRGARGSGSAQSWRTIMACLQFPVPLCGSRRNCDPSPLPAHVLYTTLRPRCRTGPWTGRRPAWSDRCRQRWSVHPL
jgi:hypothetical protein